MVINTLNSVKLNLNWNLDFGELQDDKEFVGKCENLIDQLNKTQEVLNKLLPLRERYEELQKDQKIELDLLLVYSLNSLQWIDLRLQGIDVSKHPIKDELVRIRGVMRRWKETKDREKRPTVNVDAAKRFVRSGLYDHKKDGAPPNKKIRFDD